LAALLLLSGAAPASAAAAAAAHHNVRVEDVASPALRSGLEAANEGRLPEAERLFRVVLADLAKGEGAPGASSSSTAAAAAEAAAAHSNLGNVLLQEGRTAEALAELTTAVDLAPGAAVPLLNRSLAYEQLAVDEQARAGAGGGGGGGGGDGPGSSAAVSTSYLEAGLADAAAACAADPTESAAFFDAGGILQRLGRTDAALAAFTRAADLAPGLPGYRLRAGTLLFETGDVDGAARTMRGVTRRAPSYGEAHAAAAAAAWAAGESGRAETDLEAALSQDSAWKRMEHVREVTRWGPKLLDAYGRLLRLEGPGT